MMLRALGLILTLIVTPACAQRQAAAWQDWHAFDRAFISEEGRVIDWTDNGRTVSEGQAYALFFALVANDRERFAQLLKWTERHLARGDLRAHLPAWLWGLAEDGERRVLDANAASDADLWIAYALMEAGRLWQRADYVALGRRVLQLVREREVVQLENGRPLLLPGPAGFVEPERVGFNPSYIVPAQLLFFAAVDPQGPWAAMLEDFPELLETLSPQGRIPDWSVFEQGRHALHPERGPVGSYDAIRVYLWAGLGPLQHPRVTPVLERLQAFAELTNTLDRIPEKWYARSSWVENHAPIGFHAALLPFYAALGRSDAVAEAAAELEAAREDELYGRPARYYDQVLVLFGKGHHDGWYRFDAQGRLLPRWAR